MRVSKEPFELGNFLIVALTISENSTISNAVRCISVVSLASRTLLAVLHSAKGTPSLVPLPFGCAAVRNGVLLMQGEALWTDGKAH